MPCAHFHFVSTRVAHKRVWGASCKSCSASARLQLGAYRAGVGVAALPALVVAGVGLALYKPTVAAVGAARWIEKLEAQYVARRERVGGAGRARAPVQSRRAARRSRQTPRALISAASTGSCAATAARPTNPVPRILVDGADGTTEARAGLVRRLAEISAAEHGASSGTADRHRRRRDE